ncbi:hypothetical protein SNEBB_002092 [Seison nebaliae]|nr:hypothetical protein SNEBB_002092 [Seison nebaliae]
MAEKIFDKSFDAPIEFIPNFYLDFDGDFTSQEKPASFQMKNISENVIVFRVQSDMINTFIVKPDVGTIDTGEEIFVYLFPKLDLTEQTRNEAINNAFLVSFLQEPRKLYDLKLIWKTMKSELIQHKLVLRKVTGDSIDSLAIRPSINDVPFTRISKGSLQCKMMDARKQAIRNRSRLVDKKIMKPIVPTKIAELEYTPKNRILYFPAPYSQQTSASLNLKNVCGTKLSLTLSTSIPDYFTISRNNLILDIDEEKIIDIEMKTIPSVDEYEDIKKNIVTVEVTPIENEMNEIEKSTKTSNPRKKLQFSIRVDEWEEEANPSDPSSNHLEMKNPGLSILMNRPLNHPDLGKMEIASSAKVIACQFYINVDIDTDCGNENCDLVDQYFKILPEKAILAPSDTLQVLVTREPILDEHIEFFKKPLHITMKTINVENMEKINFRDLFNVSTTSDNKHQRFHISLKLNTTKDDDEIHYSSKILVNSIDGNFDLFNKIYFTPKITRDFSDISEKIEDYLVEQLVALDTPFIAIGEHGENEKRISTDKRLKNLTKQPVLFNVQTKAGITVRPKHGLLRPNEIIFLRFYFVADTPVHTNYRFISIFSKIETDSNVHSKINSIWTETKNFNRLKIPILIDSSKILAKLKLHNPNHYEYNYHNKRDGLRIENNENKYISLERSNDDYKHRGHLKIGNPNEHQPVFFKVKVSNVVCCRVDPPIGVVQPLSKITLNISSDSVCTEHNKLEGVINIQSIVDRENLNIDGTMKRKIVEIFESHRYPTINERIKFMLADVAEEHTIIESQTEKLYKLASSISMLREQIKVHEIKEEKKETCQQVHIDEKDDILIIEHEVEESVEITEISEETTIVTKEEKLSSSFTKTDGSITPPDQKNKEISNDSLNRTSKNSYTSGDYQETKDNDKPVIPSRSVRVQSEDPCPILSRITSKSKSKISKKSKKKEKPMEKSDRKRKRKEEDVKVVEKEPTKKVKKPKNKISSIKTIKSTKTVTLKKRKSSSKVTHSRAVSGQMGPHSKSKVSSLSTKRKSSEKQKSSRLLDQYHYSKATAKSTLTNLKNAKLELASKCSDSSVKLISSNEAPLIIGEFEEQTETPPIKKRIKGKISKTSSPHVEKEKNTSNTFEKVTKVSSNISKRKLSKSKRNYKSHSEHSFASSLSVKSKSSVRNKLKLNSNNTSKLTSVNTAPFSSKVMEELDIKYHSTSSIKNPSQIIPTQSEMTTKMTTGRATQPTNDTHNTRTIGKTTMTTTRSKSQSVPDDVSAMPFDYKSGSSFIYTDGITGTMSRRIVNIMNEESENSRMEETTLKVTDETHQYKTVINTSQWENTSSKKKEYDAGMSSMEDQTYGRENKRNILSSQYITSYPTTQSDSSPNYSLKRLMTETNSSRFQQNCSRRRVSSPHNRNVMVLVSNQTLDDTQPNSPDTNSHSITKILSYADKIKNSFQRKPVEKPAFLADDVQLLDIQPFTDLRFIGSFKETLTAVIHIRNIFTESVVFTIKPSHPYYYKIEPNQYTLRPKDSVVINVQRNALRIPQENFALKTIDHYLTINMAAEHIANVDTIDDMLEVFADKSDRSPYLNQLYLPIKMTDGEEDISETIEQFSTEVTIPKTFKKYNAITTRYNRNNRNNRNNRETHPFFTWVFGTGIIYFAVLIIHFITVRIFARSARTLEEQCNPTNFWSTCWQSWGE